MAAAVAAAWVAWAVWTCNTHQRVFGQKERAFGPLFFVRGRELCNRVGGYLLGCNGLEGCVERLDQHRACQSRQAGFEHKAAVIRKRIAQAPI